MHSGRGSGATRDRMPCENRRRVASGRRGSTSVVRGPCAAVTPLGAIKEKDVELMSDQCIQISKLLDRASSHIPSHTWPHLFLILSPAHATLRALVEGRHRLVSRSYLQLLEVRAAICAFWTIGIRLVSILPSLCAPEHVVDSLVLQRHLAAHCGFQLVCIRARLAIEAHHAIRILEQQKVAAQWTEMHGGGGGRRRRRGASSSATPPWMAPRASTRAGGAWR
jgi:hypothetical protein